MDSFKKALDSYSFIILWVVQKDRKRRASTLICVKSGKKLILFGSSWGYLKGREKRVFEGISSSVRIRDAWFCSLSIFFFWTGNPILYDEDLSNLIDFLTYDFLQVIFPPGASQWYSLLSCQKKSNGMWGCGWDLCHVRSLKEPKCFKLHHNWEIVEYRIQT